MTTRRIWREVAVEELVAGGSACAGVGREGVVGGLKRTDRMEKEDRGVWVRFDQRKFALSLKERLWAFIVKLTVTGCRSS